MPLPYKPILCLDFDGVLHSYTSGWKGAANIPDEAVPGAMDFIIQAMGQFEVHIHSSRSHQWGGRRAMKRWIRTWMMIWDHDTKYDDKPAWVRSIIAEEGFGSESHEVMCREVGRRIVKQIKFPRHKPPALVTIDDRAFQFNGTWPSMGVLKHFKPWNKQ